MDNKHEITSGFAVSQEEREHEETKVILEEVIDKLKELGAKEQLLMFVTGLAGAGKVQQSKLRNNSVLSSANQWISSEVITHFSSLQSLDVQ